MLRWAPSRTIHSICASMFDLEPATLFCDRRGGTAFRPRGGAPQHDAAAVQPADPGSRTYRRGVVARSHQPVGAVDAGRPKLPPRSAADPQAGRERVPGGAPDRGWAKPGSIKIGFTATTAYGFMPDLIAACRTRLPEVDLSLKEMFSGDQLEALVSGQLDVGLLRPPVGRPEFASVRVVAERLLVAVSARACARRSSTASRRRSSTVSPSSCIRLTNPDISMISSSRC